MPRYITSGANFTPFTYDELVKPIDNMTNAQIAEQDAIDNLAMESGAIASMIDSDSPIAKKMYDDYMASLKSLTDDLYNNGFSAAAARGLSNARKDYGEKIAKINAAITNKNEDVKNYLDRLKSDDTTIFEKDPRTMGVDAWLNDSKAGSGNYYSGKKLMAQAASVGENVRRDIFEDDRWKSILGNQYWEKGIFIGFHINDINEAIRREKAGTNPTDDNIGVLQNLIRNVYGTSGIDKWASPDQKSRALDYIGNGIYSAVGDHNISRLDNKNFTSDYQWAVFNEQKAQNAFTRARSGGGANDKSTFMPGMAQMRGEVIVGPSSGKEGRTYKRLVRVKELLEKFSDMESIYDENGNPTAEAVAIKKELDGIKEFRDRNINIKGDLSSVIKDISSEIDAMGTSRSQYDFAMDDKAASNVATKLFARNIGEIAGKKAGKKAESIAKYSNGESVDKNDLDNMLNCSTVAISLDFDKQCPVIYDRGGTDGKKVSDKQIYLDPSVLSNAYASVNMGDYLYLTNPTIVSGETEGPQLDYTKIFAEADNSYQTIPLTEVARVLAKTKEDMKSAINVYDSDSATDEEIQAADVFIAHYNSLVNALGMGLYNSSNVNYQPSPYHYSWSKEDEGGNGDILDMLYGG